MTSTASRPVGPAVLRDRLDALLTRLRAPVDGASIAVFRIVLCLIAMWEVYRYFANDWIARYWIDPAFHFSYHGFSWVQPLPGTLMYLLWGVAAAGITLGDPEDELAPWQYTKMAIRPEMLREYAHHVADRFAAQGIDGVEVYATATASLNGREPQPLVDPTVDLAAQPRSLRPAPWIVPIHQATARPGSTGPRWHRPTPERRGPATAPPPPGRAHRARAV